MKLRIIHNEEDDYYLIQKKWLWYWETCDYVWSDGDLSFNATSSKDGEQFKSLDGCNILVERYIKYHSSIKTKVIKEYNTIKQ